jgi:hypothetical protein
MTAFVFLVVSFASCVLSMVDSTCTIFTSNGLANSSFSYYRFYDFRKVSGLSSTSTQNSTTAVKIVTDGTWTNDWYIRDYPRKSAGPPNIPVDFTPKRVSIGMIPNIREYG